MSNLTKEVIRRIRRVLPDATKFYALHEPTFIGNELKYASECITTGWVSSAGKYVNQIELQLAEYVGTKRAVAVVNGTAALQIALVAAGLKAGDEVLVPSLTFVATANAIVHAGGVPHFLDTEADGLNINPAQTSEYLNGISTIANGECKNKYTGRRIFAVIPVHILGHACKVDELARVADRYRLRMIEDIAEGLGTYLQGKHVGRFGMLAALSFNGNKIVTTGGGGAVFTDDDKLADLIKHLTTTAKLPHEWEYAHDRVGYNFRMPNINAALGCAQMERMKELLTKKRLLAKHYAHAFEGLDEVRFLEESPGCQSNYWLNAIRLVKPSTEIRNQLLRALNDEKIQSRPLWRLLHQLPMYSNAPCAPIMNAARHQDSIINIPSSPFLADGKA